MIVLWRSWTTCGARLSVGRGCASANAAFAVLVDALDPNDVPLCDASGLWKAFDCIERLAANAKLLLAARVEEAGAWKDAGGAFRGGAPREAGRHDDE
jgi:hypothetical protein